MAAWCNACLLPCAGGVPAALSAAAAGPRSRTRCLAVGNSRWRISSSRASVLVLCPMWTLARGGGGGGRRALMALTAPLWRAGSAVRLVRTLHRRGLLPGAVWRGRVPNAACASCLPLTAQQLVASGECTVDEARRPQHMPPSMPPRPCRPAPSPPHSAARCSLLRPGCVPHLDQRVTAGRQEKNERNEKQKLGAWV